MFNSYVLGRGCVNIHYINTVDRLFPAGSSGCFVQVFVVYADRKGSEIVEANVRALQKQFPRASIIGGLCLGGESRFVGHHNNNANAESCGGGGGESGSNVSNGAAPFSESDLQRMKVSQLKTLIRKSLSAAAATRALKDVVEKSDLVKLALSAVTKRAKANAEADAAQKASELNQVFGVALGGNVPLRSIVSRGASSIFQRDARQGAFNFRVRSSTQTDDYHRIDSIDVLPCTQNSGPASATPSATTVSGSEFIIEYGLRSAHGIPRFSPQFVGVQRPGEDGYLLYQLHGDCLQDQSLLLAFDEDDEDAAMSIENASIDLFGLDAESAEKDLDATYVWLWFLRVHVFARLSSFVSLAISS